MYILVVDTETYGERLLSIATIHYVPVGSQRAILAVGDKFKWKVMWLLSLADGGKCIHH